MTSIPERCGGSRRISWSDDSYAYYNIECSGCPDCAPAAPVEDPQGPPEPYDGPWDQPPKGGA